EARVAAARTSGAFAARRTRQVGTWFEHTVRERLLARFFGDPAFTAAMAKLRTDVLRGAVLPAAAARALLALQPPR
ncbi:MAG: methylmalonyl Co-A mutase-associated GTPase MeaB, partial [Planctomycetota bacterium]